MKFCTRVNKYHESRVIYECLKEDNPAVYLLFGLCNYIAGKDTVNQGRQILEDLKNGKLHEIPDYNVKEVTKLENYTRTGKLKYDMTELAKDGIEIGELLYMAFKGIWHKTTKDLNSIIDENTLAIIELILNIDAAMQEADPSVFEACFHQLMNQYDLTETEEQYLAEKNRRKVTMEWLQEKQEQELQKVMEMGIMDHADKPSNQYLESVDYEYHKSLLSCDFEDDIEYKKAYAKIRYFFNRKDNLLISKLDEYGKYIALNFYKFRPEQQKALFAIIKKLELIQADMVRLNPELGKYLGISNDEGIEGSRYFAIYINLLKMFEKPWFKEFSSDKKYSLKWIEQFLNDLMRSEWRDEIADEWYKPDMKKTVLGYIIGCLITAGVLEGSDSSIGSAVVKHIKFDDKAIMGKTMAINFGKGRKKGYCDWICDYVKH